MEVKMKYNKAEIFASITQKIKERLEYGTIPWQRSWTVGIPRNLISKKAYTGLNFMSLCLQEYPSPYYLTYLQCQQKAGTISKGAKGSLVVYWQIKELTVTGNETDELDVKRFPLIRYSYVFNLSETSLYKDNVDEQNKVVAFEEILNNMNTPPVIRHNIARCYYNANEDYISLPQINDFNCPQEYYSSLAHELVHWTGSASRLNRLQSTSFGTDEYSQEELIAEIGSAYLCAMAGIAPKVIDNQAAYINGWLKQLNKQADLFIDASIQAQKAVNYLLNKSLELPK